MRERTVAEKNPAIKSRPLSELCACWNFLLSLHQNRYDLWIITVALIPKKSSVSGTIAKNERSFLPLYDCSGSPLKPHVKT